MCGKLEAPFLANVTGLGSSFNNPLLRNIVVFLDNKSLRKANCVFFQNEYNMNLFIQKKIVKGNFDLIPGSGINLKSFDYYEYPSDNNGIIFNFIGRVMKEKGIEEYLYAARTVKEKYPNTTFNIWGTIEDDQLEYINLIDEYVKLGYVNYGGFYVNYGGFIDRELIKEEMIRGHYTILPSHANIAGSVIIGERVFLVIGSIIANNINIPDNWRWCCSD